MQLRLISTSIKKLTGDTWVNALQFTTCKFPQKIYRNKTVGIKTSNTDQIRWERHHNTFAPSHILCHFLHTPTRHFTASLYQTTYVCHVQPQFIKVHNTTHTANRPSTAHALHSFCIQDKPYLLCPVTMKLQPLTTSGISIQNNPPICTQLKIQGTVGAVGDFV